MDSEWYCCTVIPYIFERKFIEKIPIDDRFIISDNMLTLFSPKKL